MCSLKSAVFARGHFCFWAISWTKWRKISTVFSPPAVGNRVMFKQTKYDLLVGSVNWIISVQTLVMFFRYLLLLWSKHYDLIALYTTLSTKSHYMHTGPARAYRLTRQQPWVEAQSGSKKDRYFSLSFGHSFGIIALISTSYLPLVIIILN